MYNQVANNDTIVALATPAGVGAIAVIRLSGNNAFKITQQVFKKKNLKPYDLYSQKTHTLHFGVIVNAEDFILDEVLISLFYGPHSYTGEDVIEISCHGSVYIQQQLIQLLIKNGARLATAGEYTLRAFLNGKFDLSQAEAVADIIASNSATSHQVSMQQMRGGFSSKIATLRENLINFAALIELELDFSEEDVEFANRDDLKELIQTILNIVQRLISSFELGNVIKSGIPVAIVGKPNAGKSTLLNALLNEERAIVSEIPGTTRDTIEDEITIGGVRFRFIDTAGIRATTDEIETIGVERTFEKINNSAIVIYMFDVAEMTRNELNEIITGLQPHLHNAQLVLVGNKCDKAELNELQEEYNGLDNLLFISAKHHSHLDALHTKLIALFDERTTNVPETVVTNARHVESLQHTQTAINSVLEGLSTNIPSDLIAQDIRQALYHLGIITGQVSNDDLLSTIFSKFCIGK
jgi:tRNA modification GTPase